MGLISAKDWTLFGPLIVETDYALVGEMLQGPTVEQECK